MSRSTARRVLGSALAAGVAAALAVLVVPVVAASTGSEGTASTGGTDSAYLRAAHLVPDLPAMDVTLSSFAGTSAEGPAEPVLTITAGYGDVGEYAPLNPGFYAVALRPAGSPADEAPILTATFEARAGQAYTGAGVGTADDARIEFFEDDLSAPGDGQARIRVVNAARQADPVDVDAVDGPVVAQGAAYATATGYASVPAQSWQLRASGGGVSGTAATDLDANAVYSLLVLEASGGSLTVRPVVDAVGATSSPVGGADTGLGGGPGSMAGAGASEVVSPRDAATALLIGVAVAASVLAAATAARAARARPGRP